MAGTKKDLVPIKVDALQVQMKLDENSVVAVAVAKAERHLHRKLRELTTQITAKQKELTKLQKVMHTEDEEEAAKITKEAKGHFEKAFACLDKDNGFKLHITHSRIRKEDEFTVHLQLSNKTSHYNLQATVERPLTGTQKLQDQQETRLNEELAELQNHALELKRKTAQIPVLERQYRANLIENHLQQTDAGKALLDAFDIQLDEDLNFLPGDEE